MVVKGGDKVLKDCLEIFEEEMKRTEEEYGDSDRLILDEYIPADGDYLLVKKNGTVKQCFVHLDKKTRNVEVKCDDSSLYEEIKFYDYHSRLVSMDKPQDPKKIVHSNNYDSFWIKQENLENGKCDITAVNRYFDVLKSPEEKYKKPQDKKMYEYIVEQIGEVDKERLEQNRSWVVENIFELEKIGIQLSGKNYLKIFFEADAEEYRKEEQRYLMTKIFNKNDYNLILNGTILGLPNDNLGLNSKKPFLENKTRKITVPYLVTPEEAVTQRKFLDYLMNQANLGKTDIFFDSNQKLIISKKSGELVEGEFSGFFLKIQKGKEVEIHHQDTIVDYCYHLRKKFKYKNVLELDDKQGIYKEYGNKKEIQSVINEVIFSKWLISNYFQKEDEIAVDGEIKRNLVASRDTIFAWIYKNNDVNIDRVLHQVSLNMVKNSIRSSYIGKAGQQFNLMCSFKEYFGGCDMADRYEKVRESLSTKINCEMNDVIDSDVEYFYAVGQLVNYFISLSKSKEKMYSLANPFFNAANNQVIQQRLKQFFMKYNYQIKSRKFGRLYAMVLGYIVEEKIQQEDIIAGYLSNSLIYESKKNMEEK